MADYTLFWTDTNLKPAITIHDFEINRDLTSLALTGHGAHNWGERLQENLIRILENFASFDAPPQLPTFGQFWFDVNDKQLKMLTTDNVWVVIWPQQIIGAAGSGTPTPTPAPTPTPTPAPTATPQDFLGGEPLGQDLLGA